MEGGRNQLLNLHQRILALLMLVSTWCRAAFCILILYNCFFLNVNVVDSAAYVISGRIFSTPSSVSSS